MEARGFYSGLVSVIVFPQGHDMSAYVAKARAHVRESSALRIQNKERPQTRKERRLNQEWGGQIVRSYSTVFKAKAPKTEQHGSPAETPLWVGEASTPILDETCLQLASFNSYPHSSPSRNVNLRPGQLPPQDQFQRVATLKAFRPQASQLWQLHAMFFWAA